MGKYDIAGVYKIQNKKDNKTYIGQSIDILGRWRTHIRDAWQGEPKSQIAKAMKKEGPEQFTFSIEARFNGELSTQYLRGLLKAKEVELIEQYDSYHNGYNADLGGNTSKQNWK